MTFFFLLTASPIYLHLKRCLTIYQPQPTCKYCLANSASRLIRANCNLSIAIRNSNSQLQFWLLRFKSTCWGKLDQFWKIHVLSFHLGPKKVNFVLAKWDFWTFSVLNKIVLLMVGTDIFGFQPNLCLWQLFKEALSRSFGQFCQTFFQTPLNLGP